MKGFTLAEVLITLAIIGVVATMTLPALLNNTAEQQYKTGLKKGINTLTEAANMNQAIDGWDFSSITSEKTDNENDQSVYALLQKRTAVDKTRTDAQKNKNIGGALVTGNCNVFLRDGSAISFNAKQSTADARKVIQDDNLPLGVAVVYDTNGLKGPNQLSNCSGKIVATGGIIDDKATGQDGQPQAVCSDKTKRVIKDQFGLRLRGAVVVPNGEAARWAFEN